MSEAKKDLQAFLVLLFSRQRFGFERFRVVIVGALPRLTEFVEPVCRDRFEVHDSPGFGKFAKLFQKIVVLANGVGMGDGRVQIQRRTGYQGLDLVTKKFLDGRYYGDAVPLGSG